MNKTIKIHETKCLMHGDACPAEPGCEATAEFVRLPEAAAEFGAPNSCTVDSTFWYEGRQWHSVIEFHAMSTLEKMIQARAYPAGFGSLTYMEVAPVQNLLQVKNREVYAILLEQIRRFRGVLDVMRGALQGGVP